MDCSLLVLIDDTLINDNILYSILGLPSPSLMFVTKKSVWFLHEIWLFWLNKNAHSLSDSSSAYRKAEFQILL